jgi:polyvinyl alcohol dehydrogenase (cytochrome)
MVRHWALVVTASTLVVGLGLPAAVRAASRAGGSDWPAYGHDLGNSRAQPRAGDINVRGVGRLRVAWAARDRGLDANGDPGFVTSTPAVEGGLAVWADWRGDVHAVDVSSGAVRWVTHIAGPSYFEQINSSPAIAGDRIFVSTGTGTVVALDRATGKPLWSTVVDDVPDTDLFSSPVVVGSTVVVGVSSVQLAFPLNPYTFYGNIVALDAHSGRIRWRAWAARPGVDGPGGSVWSSAAVDPELGLLYIGTGQAYEAPAESERARISPSSACGGSCSSAKSSRERWSSALFAPAFPGRRIPARISRPHVAISGLNPNPPL